MVVVTPIDLTPNTLVRSFIALICEITDLGYWKVVLVLVMNM